MLLSRQLLFLAMESAFAVSASAFDLYAPPNSDLWKKPPSHDVFTATYKTQSTAPLSHFQSANITFTAHYVQQYDQAGLLFTLLPHGSSASDPTNRKWIKTGIEFFEAIPRYSTVGTDLWSDWGIQNAVDPDAIRDGKKSVTIHAERREEDIGLSLWLYVLDGPNRIPLREINWIYGVDNDKWDLSVSAMVARPGTEIDASLKATFKDFHVEWKKPSY